MTADSTPRPVRDLLRLDGMGALVTGASRGIGAAIARRLGEAGADVAVGFRKSEAEAGEVAASIEAGGRTAVAISADVTSESEASRLVAETVGALGRLDILVNNAGIYPLSPLLELAESEWDAVIDANLKSVHLMTRAAGRRMCEQGAGSVVNIASVEGLVPAPNHAHYTAAKAGVIMHTRAAALELGPSGVRVNAVAPGLIGRDGLAEAWPEGVARWREVAPLGRLGTGADVADACLFLASEAARWITGTTLPVDGGVLARPVF